MRNDCCAMIVALCDTKVYTKLLLRVNAVRLEAVCQCKIRPVNGLKTKQCEQGTQLQNSDRHCQARHCMIVLASATTESRCVVEVVACLVLLNTDASVLSLQPCFGRRPSCQKPAQRYCIGVHQASLFTSSELNCFSDRSDLTDSVRGHLTKQA